MRSRDPFVDSKLGVNERGLAHDLTRHPDGTEGEAQHQPWQNSPPPLPAR